jgi:hypothetical protein
MKKEHILSEIKRTAVENDGIPLGIDRFSEATGIRKTEWYGKYWTKWSDAQKEAGLNPNQKTPAYDEQWMLQKIAAYVRELGHFPTEPEFKIKKYNDKDFPNNDTLKNRFGRKQDLIKKVFEYCSTNNDLDDVKEICSSLLKYSTSTENEGEEQSNGDEAIGHVYLLKHDKVYKIGQSIDVTRRYKEIRTQMPYTLEEVHVIETDDPSGIEAYWHNRFKDKRLEGEWFKLTAQDIKIFKKRRFM